MYCTFKDQSVNHRHVEGYLPLDRRVTKETIILKNKELRPYRVRPSEDIRKGSGAPQPGEPGSWKRGVVSVRAKGRVGHVERR